MSNAEEGSASKQEEANSVKSRNTTSAAASKVSRNEDSSKESTIPAGERKSTEKNDIVCSNLRDGSNMRSLKAMSISSQPKTCLQRPVMWKYIGVLKPRALIGKKFCDLGCKIH